MEIRNKPLDPLYLASTLTFMKHNTSFFGKPNETSLDPHDHLVKLT